MKNNKILNPFYAFLILAISVFMVGCEGDINDENYLSDSFVGFSADQNIDVIVGETIDVEVKIFASKSSDSDRTYTIYADDSSTADPTQYTVPNSITISAGSMEASMNVTVTGGTFGSEGASILIGMQTEQGLDMPTSSIDGNAVEKKHIINAKDLCLDNLVSLEIIFDDYPEENGWQLYEGANASGAVIAQGGLTGNSISGYGGETSFLANFCLASGDYTLVMYDVYSDGMCCAYGDGSYTLSKDDGTVLVSGGSFGANDIKNFTL